MFSVVVSGADGKIDGVSVVEVIRAVMFAFDAIDDQMSVEIVIGIVVSSLGGRRVMTGEGLVVVPRRKPVKI